MFRRLIAFIKKRQNEANGDPLFWDYVYAVNHGTPEQHLHAYEDWRQWCDNGYDLGDSTAYS